MTDCHSLAQTALAEVPIPPGRRDIETDNLASVMEVAAREARAYGVPEEEIAAQISITADNQARCLALAYAPARKR